MGKYLRWTVALLAVSALSIVGVQQLIKRIHYGSGYGGSFVARRRYIPLRAAWFR